MTLEDCKQQPIILKNTQQTTTIPSALDPIARELTIIIDSANISLATFRASVFRFSQLIRSSNNTIYSFIIYTSHLQHKASATSSKQVPIVLYINKFSTIYNDLLIFLSDLLQLSNLLLLITFSHLLLQVHMNSFKTIQHW